MTFVTCPDCANLIADGIWTGDRAEPTIPESVRLTKTHPTQQPGPCHWCSTGPLPQYQGEFYESEQP